MVERLGEMRKGRRERIEKRSRERIEKRSREARGVFRGGAQGARAPPSVGHAQNQVQPKL